MALASRTLLLQETSACALPLLAVLFLETVAVACSLLFLACCITHQRMRCATSSNCHSSMHMRFVQAKEPFVPPLGAYAIVVAGAANARLQIVPVVPTTAVLALISAVWYFQYVSSVVVELANYLNLRVFKIKPASD